MPGALRIQAVTLPVRDLDAADRFYRWSFDLKSAGPRESGDGLLLGWEREDRLRLLDASAEPGAEETITFRLPALELEEAVAWCTARGLEPTAIALSPQDAERAAGLLAGVPVEALEHPECQNISLVTVRAWGGQRVELGFPLPKATLARRERMGPFRWSSTDWSGLENPGLLGITWGGPEVEAGRRLCESLGLGPMDAEEAGPNHLRVGDQQLILEERESPGILGLALVVPEARVDVARRTIQHLGAEFRHAGNRLIARDPDGRLVFVQGSHVR